MPPVSTGGRHGYIGPNQFESFQSRGMKTSNSATTGSLSSSENARASPVTPDRMLGISPRSYSSPSEKDARMHTRTNFTRAYVPPVVPVSPGLKGYPSDRSRMNPFDDDDAPDDEIRHRTVRSLRPRPDRYYTPTDDAPPSRPEAYISETDESSTMMGTNINDIPLEQRSRESSQEPCMAPAPVVSPHDMEARHAEDVKNSPTRSYGKEARHAEDVKISPIPSLGKEAPSPVEEVAISQRSSFRHDQTEDLPERRRRRRKDKRSSHKIKPGDAPDFDRRNKDEEEWSKSIGDEMEYYSAGDQLQDPEEYQEFGDGSNRDDPKVTIPVSILKRDAATERSEDDEDSLFDFEGRKKERGNVRKGSLKDSSRRGRRPRRRTKEPDDEESLDQDYGVVRKRSSSLQERTQQAWTFRSQRSNSVEKPDNPSSKKDGVQFGNNDTVHHFDDDASQVTTRTSRSMNSLYTKSPESEAEDLIKDIFLIGSGVASNPGRRKIKYQPAFKRDLQNREDEGTLDDTTLGTTDDVTLNTLDDGTAGGRTTYTDPYTDATDDMSLQTSPRKSDAISMGCSPLNPVKRKDKNKEDKEEDPLLMVWGFLDALSEALGLTPSTEEQEKDESNASEAPMKMEASTKKEPPTIKDAPMMKEASTKKKPPAIKDAPMMKEAPMKQQMSLKAEVSSKKKMPREAPKTREAPTMKARISDEVLEVKNSQGSFAENVMGYLFHDAAGDKDKNKKSPVSSAASMTTSSTALEEDPRLEELALHAVRSKHQLHDVVFDESVTIDIVNDIKFSLVRMALPLGILFHENDGGCWITKVFPDGNAAKVGGVEVGDQLAAINGISAIKLRVDQICTLITEAPNPKDIELTFLRYIGKLHPIPVGDQEQFEITSLQPLPIKSPPSKIRSLRPKTEGQDVEPKWETSLRSKNKAQVPSQEATETKRGFKWFGRGKKN